MRWDQVLAIIVIVGIWLIDMINGGKTKSGSGSGTRTLSAKLPKIVSDNKLVFGLVAGFLVYWLMDSELFKGLPSCSEQEEEYENKVY